MFTLYHGKPNNNKLNIRVKAMDAALQLSRRSSSFKLEFTAVSHLTVQNTGQDVISLHRTQDRMSPHCTKHRTGCRLTVQNTGQDVISLHRTQDRMLPQCTKHRTGCRLTVQNTGQDVTSVYKTQDRMSSHCTKHRTGCHPLYKTQDRTGCHLTA